MTRSLKLKAFNLTLLSALLTVVLPPAPIPSGLCATLRWQYGAESAQTAAALLDYPCHHNWIADSYGVPRHTPMAFTMRPSYVASYVAEVDRGEFWLVGNEPNISATPIAPEDAAEFARQWEAQTAVPWACCGTLHHWQHPSLLAWLDSYLAAGGPIPHAWHLHIYFVADGAQWDATLAQFRAWMVRHDVVRPLVISETAQTNDYSAQALLRHVAQAVCDGEVSAVYWYIGDRDAYNFAPQSQLTIDGAITPLGELFTQLQTCPEATVAPETPQPVPWRMYVPAVSVR